jgi:formylglycine-generating enzyme required for sulfatase activity
MEFTPNDSYDYSAIDGWNGSKVVRTVAITVNKAAGAAVTTPTVSTGTPPTSVSITVNAASLQTQTGQSVEYAILTVNNGSPTSWQSGTTFTRLIANTTYYVYARSASNANYNEGTANVSAGITTTAISIEMVLIPAGTFMMGSPAGEPDRQSNETQHQVTLMSGFYMGKYQVTQEQWEAVTGKTIQEQQGGSNDYGRGENYPIYYVSWYDTVEFCNKLSIMKELNPVYSLNGKTNPNEWGTKGTGWNTIVMDMSKNGYRLPTEAEWEYACRGDYPNKATETNTMPFGIGDGTKMVNGMASFEFKYPYDLNHAPPGEYNDSGAPDLSKAAAVGTYQANNYGLYDMHGNMWEWCWDWYKANITADNIDPTGAVTGTNRVLRGGSWRSHGFVLRSAVRLDVPPSYSDSDYGFRLVRSAQ